MGGLNTEILGLGKLLFMGVKQVRCSSSLEDSAALGEKGLRALSDGAIEKSALSGCSTLSLLMKINAVLAHQL